MVKISRILENIEYKAYPHERENDDIEICDVVSDSRKADKNVLFVCIRGAVSDGHSYARAAYDAGARDFICEERLDLPCDAYQYITVNTRIALARASLSFFGHPEKKLKLIGITGTKGKTSVSGFIYNILIAAGKKAVLIGTAGSIDARGERRKTKNTTPESRELAEFFANAAEDGAEYAVLEVSSQAYLTHRTEGLHFAFGVYTNLSEDHIGGCEHPDFENYRYCKSLLFANSDISVINVDDENAGYMRTAAAGKCVSYGMCGADYTACDRIPVNSDGILGVRYEPSNGKESYTLSPHSPGDFSVYNSMAAAAVCELIGIDKDDIIKGTESTVNKGRFEKVDSLPGVSFIIDYAHNEVSLRTALSTLRELGPKRLICLFGSVGGRTEVRRKSLGKTAGECADFCILTSDNPDFEDPDAIISDIEDGIAPTGCGYICIPDREKAIKYAVRNAESGDVILLAGKGHEDYQLIRGKKVPFSERKIIEKETESLKLKA